MKYAVLAATLSALMVSGSAQAGTLSAAHVLAGASYSSVEKVQYDREDRRDRRDRHERERDAHRCGDPMSVVGAARITEGWARRLAIKAWKEQVRFRYGEEYMNYDRAEIIKDQCEESSFGGTMKRCRIVARPCKEVF